MDRVSGVETGSVDPSGVHDAGVGAPERDSLLGTPSLPDGVVDREAYEAYVRREARGLLDVLPREGVRSLYGRAREWAREAGVHDQKDPMATLIRYCAEILPLPPFSVWAKDVMQNARTHLSRLRADPGGTGDAAGSLPMEARSFLVAGDRWYAVLGVYRARDAWGGSIRFHRGPDTPVHRTAGIFRGRDPVDVASRFRSFDDASLRAFLRSVRP